MFLPPPEDAIAVKMLLAIITLIPNGKCKKMKSPHTANAPSLFLRL